VRGILIRSIYFRNQNSIAKVRSDAALQFDVGVSSSPTAAMYIEEDTRNVGIGTTGPATTLDVDGLISSDQIRSKKYTSLSGSSNDWFPIGSINEHQTGPVLFQVITAYHSNMSFIVAKGYGPSQEHSITLLSSIDSNNTSYASIKGVRVRQDGQVEIQLYWASGPTVVVNVTARSTTDPVSLPSSLATSTSSENIIDTVTNEDGKLRSRKLITTSSNVQLSDNGISYLNGGNVGIGTTNPIQELQVNGSIYANGGHYFLNTTKGIYWGDSQQGIVGTTDTSLEFKTNNATQMIILDNGNVGIGTTNPSAKLHAEGSMIVKGDSSWAGTDNNNAAIYMNTNARGLHGAFSTSYARNLIQANNNYIELGNQGTSLIHGFKFYAGSTTSSVGTYDFFTSGTNSRLHIEKGGDVGIGTTDPQKHVHIRGSAPYIRLEEDSASNKRLDLYVDPSTAIAYITANQSAQQLSFQTASTDRIRIANDGKVGIGTNSPDTLLHLEASDPVLKIRDSSTTTNSATLWLQESDTYGVKINYQSNGGDRGRDLLTIDTLAASDSNNQAGNHDNAWGIDQDGYVMPHKGAVDGNLLKSYEWLLYGSQVSGSTPSFPRNGTEAENSRIYGNNPFGEPAILWYTPSQDSSDNDDGGWNSDTFIIDRGKSYRTSVWVKKTTTNTSDGNLYLGTSYVDNLNGTYNSNPYFIGGTTMASAGMENDQWYLMVGYIYDSGHTGTANHPKGGIYDRNGRKLTSANSFKFTDSGDPSDGLSSNFNTSRQRVYNYYDATTGSKTYWWGPRFEPLEASTPTLQEVLNSPTSDTGASFMGAVGVGTSTHSQTNEVKLHVYKNANRATTVVQNNNHVARLEAYGTATAIDTTASNGVIIRNNGSNRVHFDAGGNVGIGCDDPDTKLEVQNTVGAPMLHLRPDDASTNATVNPIILYRNQLNGSANYMLCAGIHTFFGTYNGGAPTDESEMIRLSPSSSDAPSVRIGDAGSTSSYLQVGGNVYLSNNSTSYINGGNVGIGTTSPSDKLEVYANGADVALRIHEDAGTHQARLHLRRGIGVTNPSAMLHVEGTMQVKGANGWAGTDTQGGSIYISTEGQAILGNMGANYARPMISSASNAITIGSNGTSAIRNIKYHAGNGAGAADSEHNFYTSGNNVRLHIAKDGNVGIGTDNPVYDLTIGGNAVGSTGGFRINDPSNVAYGAHFSFADTPNEVHIGGITNNVYNDAISINRESTRTITIDGSERVGIGTASPSNKLEVNGDVAITSKLIHHGDTDTFLEFTNNTITLDAGGEEHIKLEVGGVTINEGGQPNDFRIEGDTDTFLFFVDGSADKVGIGTSTPTALLDVDGTIKTKVHTIGALPSASPAGQRAMVSDSYYTFGSSSLGSTVYAGGSAVAPVYSDGSYWRYG
jgi:hypothetical protein